MTGSHRFRSSGWTAFLPLPAQKCWEAGLRLCPCPPWAGRRRHRPDACPCPLCTALCKPRPSHRALESQRTSLLRVLGNPETPKLVKSFSPPRYLLNTGTDWKEGFLLKFMLVFVYSEQDLGLALGQAESSASADHRPTQDSH